MIRKLPNVSCWGYSSATCEFHLNIVKRCVSSLGDEAHLFLRWINLKTLMANDMVLFFRPNLCAVSGVSPKFYFREARVLDTSSQ